MANTATIASGEALSGAVRIPFGLFLQQLVFPAAFTGTAITFQQSNDGGETFQDLYDDSGEVSYSAGANKVLVFNRQTNMIDGVVKIRSGTSASPTNEAADRDIICYFETMR